MLIYLLVLSVTFYETKDVVAEWPLKNILQVNWIAKKDWNKFNIFGSDGHCTDWRKKNEEHKSNNLLPLVKHGDDSVIFGGCMSAADLAHYSLLAEWWTTVLILTFWNVIFLLVQKKMGIKENTR